MNPEKRYKFYREHIPSYGIRDSKPCFEEMMYPHMEFENDMKANEYASLVLGNGCFAVLMEESEYSENQPWWNTVNTCYCYE